MERDHTSISSSYALLCHSPYVYQTHILDIFLNDPIWADWSEATLEKYSQHTPLYINSIIYSEVSIGFIKIDDLESSIAKA